MTDIFLLFRTTRDNILNATEGLTEAQWHKIPKGFNNNIFWNFAHIVVTQQRLCYMLTGQQPLLSKELLEDYKIGTAPRDGDSQSIDELRELMKSTAEQLQIDFESGKLDHFKPYSTSYNYKLKSIKDAIMFNNVHEAMHYGTILAMKKLV